MRTVSNSISDHLSTQGVVHSPNSCVTGCLLEVSTLSLGVEGGSGGILGSLQWERFTCLDLENCCKLFQFWCQERILNILSSQGDLCYRATEGVETS